MTAAILTGDLIGSTKATDQQVERAFACLRQTADEMADWAGTPTRFTRFRGDGWQIFLSKPQLALRAALFLQASLTKDDRALPSRLAIGLGRIEHPGSQDLSDARGSALVHSGQALDKMVKSQRLTISGDGITPLHQALVELLDERHQKWSPEQSAAMKQALDPRGFSLESMATPLGITPQAVAYRLKSAGGNVIRSVLEKWEAMP